MKLGHSNLLFNKDTHKRTRNAVLATWDLGLSLAYHYKGETLEIEKNVFFFKTVYGPFRNLGEKLGPLWDFGPNSDNVRNLGPFSQALPMGILVTKSSEVHFQVLIT